MSRFIALPKIGCRRKQWHIVNELTGGLIAEFTGGKAGAEREAKRLQAAADWRIAELDRLRTSQADGGVES